MNMPKRLKGAINHFGYALKHTGAAFATAFGQWEGWEHNRYRNRPATRLVSGDADLNFGKREQMVSEARALCQTFGIGKRILGQCSNYVVGSCVAQAKTSDEKWNEQAERIFKTYSAMADFSGRHDLRSIAKISVQSFLRDGDIFHRLTDSNGFPQLQAIEADCVGNYRGGNMNFDTPNSIGGVLITNEGIPTGYQTNVRGQYNAGNFTKGPIVPAPAMIHIFDPSRFDAYRGVTHFHAALNHMRDMKEIVGNEKISVKNLSALAMVIRNATGSADPNNLFENGTDAKTGEPVSATQIHPGANLYQFNGDELEMLNSNRPSPAWQGFMQFLIQDIAVGFDLPVEFVWSMSGLTGPGVRMSAKQAERTFKIWIELIERKLLNRYYAYVITWAMENGQLPFNPEWYLFRFARPSMPGIDAGRESDKNIKEREAGLLSAQEICEERGADAFETFEQIARETAYVQKLATQYGVPVEKIQLVGSKPVDPKPEEEPEEKKGNGTKTKPEEPEDEE